MAECVEEPDIYTVIEQRLKEDMRKAKKLRKKRKKEVNFKISEDPEPAMIEGSLVADDDIQKAKVARMEQEHIMTSPIDIESGLFKIDETGNLFVLGLIMDTDQSHKVNRQVVQQLCKEVCVTHGDDLIPLANQHTFNCQTLNQAQNRSKNKYVRQARCKIVKQFPPENDYHEFSYNGNLYYLERKNRKSKLKLTEKPDLRPLDKPKVDVYDRIVQLESENAQLRQKGEHKAKTEDHLNEQMFSDIPAVQAQVVNVQPSTEKIVEDPGFVPLSQSPALLWFRSMCNKDRANFNPNLDKEWFGSIFSK